MQVPRHPGPQGKPFPHLNDAEEFRARDHTGLLIVRTVAFTVLGAVVLMLTWLASGSCPDPGG